MKTPEERFLSYALLPTMSDESSETCPSTAKQLVLGKKLKEELEEIGLKAEIDKNGYVYGVLPGNKEGVPTVGFVSHMDTSPDAKDSPLHPRTLVYQGGDIVLNEEENIVLSPKDYPYLADYVGSTLIVTDGKTLLGADDKAGCAAIVSAMANLAASGKPHGDVKVCFTPDEEIGRGADLFDVEKFGADYAYTVDGGREGELEYENFNAASAEVEFHGVSIHPGSAKDKMKNAALYATEFATWLPEEETPRNTEGYRGFYHLCHVEGECEQAKLQYIIRDHDRAKFEKKKDYLRELVEKMNRKYGEGTVTADIKDSYYNMKEMIEPHMEIIERAKTAMEKVGMVPKVSPIRGGTDGARLSYMGLPCPNLCTGGENFHSRFEFLCVDTMHKVTRLIETLVLDLGSN